VAPSVASGGAKWFATYDNAGNQLTAIGKDNATPTPNTLTSFTYTYNQGTNDRQFRQAVTQADPVFNGTLWYGYDQFNRLCAVATASLSGGLLPTCRLYHLRLRTMPMATARA
jgi:hypothetical protein